MKLVKNRFLESSIASVLKYVKKFLFLNKKLVDLVSVKSVVRIQSDKNLKAFQ